MKSYTGIALLLTAFSAAPAFADLSSGLVAYYPFDGNANDASQFLNHGTPMGSVQYGAGQNGDALILNGTDAYVQIPNTANINFATQQDFAISVWVKPDKNQPDLGTGDNDIVEKWYVGQAKYPFVIRYINDTHVDHEKIMAAQYDGGNTAINFRSRRKLSDGEFHHIVFQRSNGVFSFYVDGYLSRSSADTTTADTTNTSDLFIGCRGNFNNGCQKNKFKGAIDELRIYNRGLTHTEIRTLFGITTTIHGNIQGYAPGKYSITCDNKTTGQTTTVTSQNTVFNCGTSGMAISIGDVVELRVTGEVR